MTVAKLWLACLWAGVFANSIIGQEGVMRAFWIAAAFTVAQREATAKGGALG